MKYDISKPDMYSEIQIIIQKILATVGHLYILEAVRLCFITIGMSKDTPLTR